MLDVSDLRFEFLQDAIDPTRFNCIERWDCSLKHLQEVQLKRAYYIPCEYHFKITDERVADLETEKEGVLERERRGIVGSRD